MTQRFLPLICLLMIHGYPLGLAPATRCRPQMVIWNVGQGAWATEIHRQICLHFDAGGEHSALPLLAEACAEKQNFLFLSHADQDHIGFAGRLAQTFPTCVESLPEGLSPRKQRMLSPLWRCPSPTALPSLPSAVQTEAVSVWPTKIFDGKNPRARHLSSNDMSRVWVSRNEWFVIPGDSTRRAEKLWRHRIPFPGKVRILLLGHHGSRTSTAEKTLLCLPHVEMAVASARQARFGHPHPEIVALLRKHHIALIRTEDWGNLHFLEE
jgi:competence protein ComEC